MTERDDRRGRAEALLAQFLRERDAGRAPDREGFLSEHDDLRDLLEQLLDDNAVVRDLVGVLARNPEADTGRHEEFKDLFKGSRIGRYRLQEEVGRGGMGVVWRAFDLSLREVVALKFLPEILARDKVALRHLRDEANLFDGVRVGPTATMRLSGNAIHDNGWLGIDLIPTSFASGVSPNDPLDVDVGGNGVQNFPVLSAATLSGAALRAVGTLHSSPLDDFTVEFFGSPSCAASGHGEGQVFLGATSVFTNAEGDADFDVLLAGSTPAGWVVTSTATLEPAGATSEFSACVAVTGGLGTNYCAAFTNSTGAPAEMSASGSPSVADNELTLFASPVPDEPGLFFFGPGQQQTPFGDGLLCVTQPIVRIQPPATASGNLATRRVDVPSFGIVAGSNNFQYWFRDPLGGGAFFNLSDGLEIVFVP